MMADIVNMLEECPEGCRHADPRVEEVMTTAIEATTLHVIVDCPHRPVCEMWKEAESVQLG